MFGLTEQELDRYKDLAQEFAITQVAPDIVNDSELLIPVIPQGGKYVPVPSFVSNLVTDVEIVITITAMHMAYEYAHLQGDLEVEEKEIIKHLHEKYETQVMNQFFKYGVVFSSDVASRIVGEIIVELPYLYVESIEDDDFNEEDFLDDRLEAYNDYLENNHMLLEDDEDDDE